MNRGNAKITEVSKATQFNSESGRKAGLKGGKESGKATRVGYKMQDGKKVRYAKKSGEEIK